MNYFCVAVVGSCLLLVGATGTSGHAQGQSPTTPVHSPVLIELFTSEGCSSCPPADRLLESLDKSPGAQDAYAVVLSEHVDYWNHDGWRDPYSSAFFTQRQRTYAARFGLDDVYTPQMVVDGRTQFVGNDSRQARNAIEVSASAPKIPIDISNLAVEHRSLKFRIETQVSPVAGPKQPEVFVVLACERATSQVSAGENSGHLLTHVSVARELTRIGVIPETGIFSKQVQLKLSEDLRPGNIRVITYLQEPGQGAVLGAAMQHVPEASTLK